MSGTNEQVKEENKQFDTSETVQKAIRIIERARKTEEKSDVEELLYKTEPGYLDLQQLSDEEKEVVLRIKGFYIEQLYKLIDEAVTQIQNYARYIFRKFEERTRARIDYAFAFKRNEAGYPVVIIEILGVKIPVEILESKIKRALELRRKILAELKKEQVQQGQQEAKPEQKPEEKSDEVLEEEEELE